MADKTIPNLTSRTEIAATDYFVVDTGVQTFKVPAAVVSDMGMTRTALTGPVTQAVGRASYQANTTAGVVTLNLPATVSTPAGFRFAVQDVSGGTALYPMVVAPNGAQKIQGLAANFALDRDYGRWVFEFDGVDWWKV